MRSVRLLALLVLAAFPAAGAQILRPQPRTRADTTRRAPEPTLVPCSVNCTPLEHESWHEYHSHVDAGLSGGPARVATYGGPGVSVPRVQGNLAWLSDIGPWQLGTSVDLWNVPSVNGVYGWGADLLLRAGRTLFEEGPEVRIGAGIGLDRLRASLPSNPTMEQSHAGLAYEATVAQEFRRESAMSVVASGGVVGAALDGTLPRMPSAMLVAGLGLRWHRWTAGEHDARRRTRNGPRWPRPLP
jgi:hypothetical protein